MRQIYLEKQKIPFLFHLVLNGQDSVKCDRKKNTEFDA